MPKSNSVGRSWRTPAKHEYVSSILGQEVGVVRFLTEARRSAWFDQTAGDAAPVDGVDWHRACSPGILANHAAASAKPVHIVLHEIKAAHYDRLLQNLGQHLPDLGYFRLGEEQWSLDGGRVDLFTRNVSGEFADVRHVRSSDAAFVLNDPNAITDWAMRPTFAQEIAERTWMSRSLSTMGCNPAGLKRCDPGERMAWFDHLATQERALPQHRDLLLASISRDEAQWAYLLCTSEKWRSKTEKVVTSIFKKYGRAAEQVWMRTDRTAFQEAKLRLFLTKTELGRIRGREAEWMRASREERLRILDFTPDAPQDDGQDSLFDFLDAGTAEAS